MPTTRDTLTPYRRHQAHCTLGIKAASYTRRPERTNAADCMCPVWLQGFLGGKRVQRSADTADWDEATKTATEWLERGSIPTQAQIQGETQPGEMTVKYAVEQYLNSRGENAASPLGTRTFQSHRNLLQDRLLTFCEAEGVTNLNSID